MDRLGPPAARLLAAIDRLAADRRTAIAVVVASALVVRVALILATPDYAPFADAADYDRHATSIAAGEGYPISVVSLGSEETAFRPPTYPYALGAVYAVSGDSQRAGQLVLGAGLGAALAVLVMLLATRLWRPREGLIAGLVAALFPPLVGLAVPLLSETAFLTLEVGAVLCGLIAIQGGANARWLAATGLLAGLAILTRSNGILIPLVIGAGMALSMRGQGLGLRQILRAQLVLFGVTALVLVPWTIRNASAFDAFVPTNTQAGFGLAGAFAEESLERDGYRAVWTLPVNTERYGSYYLDRSLNEAEVEKEVRSEVFDFISEHPGFVFENALLGVIRSLEITSVPEIEEGDRRLLGMSQTRGDLVKYSFWVGLLLSAAGIVALRRRSLGFGPGPAWLWSVPMVLFLAGVLILGFARYRVPVYPFMALLIAVAFSAGLQRLASGDGGRAGEGAGART